MRWNGYLRVDRNVANLNEANFATLMEALLAMGPQSTSAEGGLGQPANVTHDRPNDPDAPVKYFLKANFDPSEVTIETWKQFMADLFDGVEAEDIGDTFSDVSYSGGGRETREWTFSLPDGVTDRVVFARFGRGGSQEDSRLELLAYLDNNPAEWGEEIA